MAFIRKFRIKSGAVGVQVCEKFQGKVVKTTHVGSANCDGELQLLLKKARRIIDMEKNPLFDLAEFDAKNKEDKDSDKNKN